MSSHILLLEDDPILGRSLKISLELQGFDVTWVTHLRLAYESVVFKSVDLFIVDWNLPDGTGLEFCKKIRETDTTVPVLFLTAKSEEETAVEAFAAGANDYVRKPFGQAELFARIRGSLREVSIREQELRFGDLRLFVDSRRAEVDGKVLEVNRREFDVLCCLVKRADTVVSREELIGKVDPESEIFDRTIDSHVSHVRSRLKTAGVKGLKIRSVYGVGYRLEKVKR